MIGNLPDYNWFYPGLGGISVFMFWFFGDVWNPL